MLSTALLVLTTFVASQPQEMTWQIEGTQREATIYLPSPEVARPAPVVFVFHGHGGNRKNAARQFRMHQHWPEAIVVYMQGVPTPGKLTDPEGKKNGWQSSAGILGDRDLKFFDAVWKSIQEKHQPDLTRVYATGHSNGGGFTYLLWSQRPDQFTAFAPSASAARSIEKLSAKPAMHLAGENDPLVKYTWQKGAIASIKKANGLEGEGTSWGPLMTIHQSEGKQPLVTYIHPGNHQFPSEAVPHIVRFFKEQVKK